MPVREMRISENQIILMEHPLYGVIQATLEGIQISLHLWIMLVKVLPLQKSCPTVQVLEQHQKGSI